MTDARHISDLDLERYVLRMKDDEFRRLTQHLLACAACKRRARETQEYISTLKEVLANQEHGREGQWQGAVRDGEA